MINSTVLSHCKFFASQTGNNTPDIQECLYILSWHAGVQLIKHKQKFESQAESYQMFLRHNQENKSERCTDIGKKKHPSSLLVWYFESLHGKKNSSLCLKTKRLYTILGKRMQETHIKHIKITVELQHYKASNFKNGQLSWKKVNGSV